MNLSEISAFVTQRIEKALPGAAVECTLTPLLDTGLGDLGSDVFKRLAKQRHESPEAIAAQLMPVLDPCPYGQMQLVDGFLNFTLTDELLLSMRLEAAPAAAPAVILVAPPLAGLDQVGYARVIASAATQWFLSGQRSTLFSISGSLSSGASAAEFQHWFQQTLATPVTPRIADSALEQLITAAHVGPAVLWIYPDFLDRNRFRDLLDQIRSRIGADGIKLQCLDRELLTRIPDPAEALHPLITEPTLLAATCLYLSRNTPGGDLDLTIPRNQERANLRWSLRALDTRLQRVIDGWSGAKVASTPSASRALTPLERRCLVRGKLLPLFLADAVESGRVSELFVAAEELLEGCTRYLNDPRTRQEIEARGPGSIGGTIISGAKDASSAIIRACRLFQDLELIRP